jgi:hypothetical protein
MTITKKALARRTFLRGLGTVMALPLLDSMIPAMASTSKSPIRLGFVYVPNGIIPKAWLPTSEGTAFDFMPTMKPLESFREKLLVVSNLAQINGRALGDGAGDHARAAHWRPSEKDARDGYSRRCFGGSTGGQGDGQGDAVRFARNRT